MQKNRTTMKYQAKKEQARQAAIEWQINFANNANTWADITLANQKFERLAKRYGLTKEFKLNGII